MVTTDIRPITTHGVVCGLCGVAAPVTSHTLIRNAAIGSFNGRMTIDASVQFLMPDGWEFRDTGDAVLFVCDAHRLDGTPNRG